VKKLELICKDASVGGDRYKELFRQHPEIAEKLRLINTQKFNESYLKANEALRKLEKQDVELVVFGQVKDDIRGLFPVPIHSMGYLSDESKIVALYNAVDMFITSSLEENLPNTIMESMACGTPCVGFATGGIPEMIDHRVNGYVANYKDADDLASGIRWVLEHEDRQALSDACVKKVRDNYAEEVVARQYIALYKKLL